MGKDSSIQWTHHTFNPWIGCQRVSPGCEHCYAEAYDKRVGGAAVVGGEKRLRWGPAAPRVRTSLVNWHNPLKWNAVAKAAGERHRVFCASLADVFDLHESIEPSWRLELFSLIRQTPALDWQLLTKRPQNFHRVLASCLVVSARHDHPSLTYMNSDDGFEATRLWLQQWFDGNPPANVWLGTTVEDQLRANERIPHLVEAPAVVRFLSCEPLLEAVDLSQWLDEDKNGFVCRVDWVIVGGESGGKARPFALNWAESIVKQCRDAGRGDPRPFVKQLGSNPVVITGATGNFRTEEGRRQVELTAVTVPLRDHHGGDPSEWPEGLRVREFPREVRP